MDQVWTRWPCAGATGDSGYNRCAVIIRPASDHSLLVSFGNEISPEIHRNVLRLCSLLDGRPEVRNLHPAYSSVLITFNPLRATHAELERIVRVRADQLDSVALPEPRVVEIPVQYGGEFGPDLEDVARLNGLTPEDVARIHSSAEYTVYFLGFSPGFPYLGGLPSSIATPRLDTPRKHVPAGSVAIGGNQTGIYPVASPGGWRIIGRTPLALFTPQRQPITLLQMGDRVRFAGL